MLSYQHAYHAGNPADLHKHSALAALLALLLEKPRNISYLESHAGRAVYDLNAPEARKTGEAARGVQALDPAGRPGPYWDVLARVRAIHGPTAYPGSPLIAEQMLRPGDRMTFLELHPAEHAALAAALGGADIAVHRRDGHEGLPALCPPTPRRGLALIDPSYEVKDEYAQTAHTVLRVAERWPQGVVVVWYPLLPAGRHVDLLQPLLAALPGLFRHEAVFREPPPRGMTGSGLLVVNPPYGAEAALAAAWQTCAPVF